MPLQFRQTEINIKTCEICGQSFIADYGYSLGVCWLVTGHASVGSFMCDEQVGMQHWGCTKEHAIEAAIACIKDHMDHKLDDKYSEAENEGRPRISPDHVSLGMNESNPNFYFVTRGTPYELNGNSQ